MDRCPSCGTALGDHAAAPPESRPSDEPAGGARILAFPAGARRRLVERIVERLGELAERERSTTAAAPAPTERSVEIRRNPLTGWTELSGVDAPSALRELEALGLQATDDGCLCGTISAGDFRLVLATWSDLLDRAAGTPYPPAWAHRRREAPRNASARATSSRGPARATAVPGAATPALLPFPPPPAATSPEPTPRAGGTGCGCPICGKRPSRIVGSDFGLATDFPELVCPDCDGRALDAGGIPLSPDPGSGAAPNPVYVDGQRCWRLYRFGGWITMLDRHGARSFADFLDRARESRRPRA